MTTEWTPIVAPCDCCNWMILGNQDFSAMRRCSDNEDAKTSYLMPLEGWFSFSIPALYKRYRYAKGDVVTFLKGTVEGTLVTVEFYN
jgi:hypothetical protein